MSAEDVAAARARSERARGRLAEALSALKDRLLPRTIARSVVRATKDKAADAVEAGTDAVKARPALAVGAAALAALFLARKPIARAISGPDDETPAHPGRSSDEPPSKDRK